MEHNGIDIPVECLEELKINIMDFYVFTEFTGHIIDGRPYFSQKQVEDFMKRSLTEDEKEIINGN